MGTEINTDALIGGMYKNKGKLEEKAFDANFVGGFHLGPIGIPHKFLGGILQSDESRKAQDEPGAYMAAMSEFLRTLNEALDKVNARPQG